MAEHTEEKPLEDLPSRQERSREGVITAVLTADNHLGYTAFGQQSQKREERQLRLHQAFQQAVEFAIGQSVDLFLHAGDLFDTTTPDERDRSFVAMQLNKLKQAGVRAFALGGVHDTPVPKYHTAGDASPAPQMSYAGLGALHYFEPGEQKPHQLAPVLLDLKGLQVGICGLGVLAGEEGDPLAQITVAPELKQADLALLLLHAPIEGLATGTSLLDSRALVSRQSIEQQAAFRFILAGYHHQYSHLHIGQTDVIVAGATQHINFTAPDHAPGFVFLGLAANGLRWCHHVPVDAASLQQLVLHTEELWPGDEDSTSNATETILERLRPLCNPETMLLLRLEGAVARKRYHQLDLNQIRQYGEEHCLELAIDDSALTLLSEQDLFAAEMDERLSPRTELVTLADELIADAFDEREKQMLQATKEALLQALDDPKGWR